MKYALILLVFIGTTQAEVVTTKHKELIPILREYAMEYEKHMGKPLKPRYNVSVGFSYWLPNGWEGMCAYNRYIKQSPRYIYFKRDYWKQAGREMRKVLVFHELGHCLHDLPHMKRGIMKASGLKRITKQMQQEYFNMLKVRGE